MDEVALLDVFPTAQMGPAQCTTVEGERKAALDLLGPRASAVLRTPEPSRAPVQSFSTNASNPASISIACKRS